MEEIKKIKITSLAGILGAIYAVVGFFISLTIVVYALVKALNQGGIEESLLVFISFNFGVGLLAGLIVSLLTGLIGYLIGGIFAFLYNQFAKRFGGLKVEFAQEDDVLREVNTVNKNFFGPRAKK